MGAPWGPTAHPSKGQQRGNTWQPADMRPRSTQKIMEVNCFANSCCTSTSGVHPGQTVGSRSARLRIRVVVVRADRRLLCDDLLSWGEQTAHVPPVHVPPVSEVECHKAPRIRDSCRFDWLHGNSRRFTALIHALDGHFTRVRHLSNALCRFDGNLRNQGNAVHGSLRAFCLLFFHNSNILTCPFFHSKSSSSSSGDISRKISSVSKPSATSFGT